MFRNGTIFLDISNKKNNNNKITTKIPKKEQQNKNKTKDEEKTTVFGIQIYKQNTRLKIQKIYLIPEA